MKRCWHFWRWRHNHYIHEPTQTTKVVMMCDRCCRKDYHV